MDKLWMLLPAAILYGGFFGAALCKWMGHRHTRYVGRWLWLLIIMVFSLLGPAV